MARLAEGLTKMRIQGLKHETGIGRLDIERDEARRKPLSGNIEQDALDVGVLGAERLAEDAREQDDLAAAGKANKQCSMHVIDCLG
ncbi:hypothetical protein D9M72_536760 [compost metagenome]